LTAAGEERILARTVEYACPWLEVVSKQVRLDLPRGEETFYSVRTNADYAAIVAVTEDGRVPLVRVFRPAVEDAVLELPSGTIDPDEEPEAAIRRELLEETGCEAHEIVTLGVLHTDSGRMETRQWAFFAPDVRAGAAPPKGDEQLELAFVERAALPGLIASGELRMAPHVAVVCLALVQGHLSS
jgi:ADP-ribose pyrophosphatase